MFNRKETAINFVAIIACFVAFALFASIHAIKLENLQKQVDTLNNQKIIKQERVRKESMNSLPGLDIKKVDKKMPKTIHYDGLRIDFLEAGKELPFLDSSEDYKERFDIAQEYIDRDLVITQGTDFDPTDGEVTCFLGKNPGPFKFMKDMRIGDIVEVVDRKGKSYKYKIYDVAIENNNFNCIFEKTGINYNDALYEGFGFEGVTFQFNRGNDIYVYLGRLVKEYEYSGQVVEISDSN